MSILSMMPVSDSDAVERNKLLAELAVAIKHYPATGDKNRSLLRRASEMLARDGSRIHRMRTLISGVKSSIDEGINVLEGLQ